MADEREVCEICGYEWDALDAAAVAASLRAIAAEYRPIYASGDASLSVRPDPDTWSPMEYGSHVRDVMLNLRDRIVLGLAEDNPIPKPMFAAVRLDAGIYARDEAATLPAELEVAATLLARTVEALSAEQLARPVFYPYPRPETRTLLWVASQALHEAEHHLGDVRGLTSPGS